MIDEFFDLLYGDSHGYIDIVTLGDDNTLSNERWFEWPRERAVVIKYCELRTDEDVYTSVGLFSDKHRTKEDAKAVTRVAYADADTCPPSKFRLRPTIELETSQDRWHAFWVLDKEYPLNEASEASRRIAKAHKDDGCDGGWIASKVLRVPGTSNTKRHPAWSVKGTINGDVYDLNEINVAYADIDINERRVATTDYTAVPELLDVFDLLEKVDDPELFNLYSQEVEEGRSWSERLWRLELDLFRAGFNPQEVYTISWHAKCNKYHPDFAGQRTETGVVIPERRNPEEVLWAEVRKAELSWNEVIIPDEEPETSNQREFLTPEERAFVLNNPTFVDQYVQWVASKTDAAQTYSRTLAFVILSCVYGQHGFIYPKHGKERLNLFALILGDTTSTRKSTARNKALSLIRAWEKRTDSKIDLASDITAEGLSKALGDRDGLVSLIHRDEIQGFFTEAYTKTYMSGVLGTLTDLYDGHVRVALRATKGQGQSNRSEVTFNFLGVGIAHDVAEVLTDKNFRDGFLTRFVWSIADPVPITREREEVEQGNDFDEVFKEDPQIAEFCRTFQVSMRKWRQKEAHVIKMDAESLRRYNDWKWDIAQLVMASPNAATLEPSRQRLAVSVWKAAALLAMHEKSDMITMDHLLPALAQAELWFADMERMAGMISANDFQRKVDGLEAYVLTGVNQRRNIANVYKTMLNTHGLRKSEVDEIVSNLHYQGRLRQVKDDGKTYLEVI